MTRCAALLLAAFVALTAFGCGPSGPTWIDSGAQYTVSSLPSVFDHADISKYKDQSVSKSGELRQQALVGLRSKGPSATSAADLITKTLPQSSAGVPVYVERASVGGRPAYILVEAFGPPGGKLTMKRMWALADTGAVLYVGTR